MQAFIPQPERIPFLLRIGIWFSERVTGKIMLSARILSWYPEAAFTEREFVILASTAAQVNYWARLIQA